ncbi:MAG: DUF2341 domain-containing protein [Planctomycetota bacterium]|nr:DUF2341 domain-containing protein [Planctomycetota bacterium]
MIKRTLLLLILCSAAFAEPVEISTLQELQLIASGSMAGDYVLTADIDASDTAEDDYEDNPAHEDFGTRRAGKTGSGGFLKIGTNGARFTGTIDGNGHTITGLTIHRNDADYNGFVGYLEGSGASISNLVLLDVDIVDNSSRVGGLVGLMNGGPTVSRCAVTGTVSTTSTGGRIGGIAGWAAGTITESWCDVEVTSPGQYSGGLAGNIDYVAGCSVTNCYAEGSITLSGGGTPVGFGGFAGRIYQSVVANCWSNVVVTYSSTTNRGFSGYVDAGGAYSETGTYWDTEVSGHTASAGNATGKTTAQMQALATFSGWDIIAVGDFDPEDPNVWTIDEGEDYPRLGWQYEVTSLAKATDPSPADEATGVATNATLSWAEVADANDYNVYFGRVGTSLTLYSNVDTNSISIPLDEGIEYQWRVDPNDPDTGATTGDVWTFTTAATTEDPDEPEEPEDPDEPTGWLTGWSYRKKITIDHNKVDAALTDLPVLVALAADPNVGANAHADGNDVRFTASDGETLLDAEAETWSVADSNATALLWVRVPTVAADANTVFYLYYGHASAEAAWDASGVWDANYIGVWHMDDATTSTISDSTSYAGTGTKIGADHPVEATGTLGMAQDFNGTDTDGIVIADSDEWDFSGSDSFTVSAWVQPDTGYSSTATYPKIVEKGDNTAAYEWQLNVKNTGIIYISISGAGLTSTGLTLPVDEWSHVAYSQSGSTGALVTLNGGADTFTAAAYKPAIPTGDSTAHIGQRYGGTGGIDGTIDEVRVSNIARSAAYLKADYHSTAGSLVTMGTEEEAESGEDPVPPVAATNVSPADGATNVSIYPTLSWTFDGDTCDIYVGTSLVLVASESTATSYQPGPLAYETIYVWRIDVTDPNGTTTGDVWTFTTAATTEDPDEPEEPEDPEEPTGWQREPQWRKGPPAWQKRETGLEGWRRR